MLATTDARVRLTHLAERGSAMPGIRALLPGPVVRQAAAPVWQVEPRPAAAPAPRPRRPQPEPRAGTLSLAELVRTALATDPHFARQKFEDFRGFSASVAIVVATVASLLWVWDYIHDPAGAQATMALRALFPLLVAPYVAALLMRLPATVAVGCWLFAIMGGEAVYTEILHRLDGGMALGLSGYVYFLFIPLLTAGSLSVRVNLAGILLASDWPLALALGDRANGMDWSLYFVEIWPAAGMTACAVCAFSYVYRMNHQYQRKLEAAVATDSMTGAANRRRFNEVLSDAVLRSRRYRSPLSVIMFDIDHFKRINDSWGHATGDRAICQVVEIAQMSAREVDLVGRLGGEEFAVILPETDIAAALTVAERIRTLIRGRAVTADNGTVFQLTCSFGVTAFRESDATFDAILSRADAALYCAKNAGRDRVQGAV